MYLCCGNTAARIFDNGQRIFSHLSVVRRSCKPSLHDMLCSGTEKVTGKASKRCRDFIH